MNRRRVLEGIAAGTTVGLAGLAGCADGGPEADEPEDGGDGAETPTEGGAETPTEEGTPTDGEGADKNVLMETEGEEYYFDPIGLLVEPGTTVTFELASGSHSATAYAEGNGPAEVDRIPEEAEPWDSGTLSEEGATFEHTFEVEGTYDYFCIPHKSLGMVGRIVCGSPGGPGEEGSPPDGSVPDSQTIVDQGSVSYEEFSE